MNWNHSPGWWWHASSQYMDMSPEIPHMDTPKDCMVCWRWGRRYAWVKGGTVSSTGCLHTTANTDFSLFNAFICQCSNCISMTEEELSGWLTNTVKTHQFEQMFLSVLLTWMALILQQSPWDGTWMQGFGFVKLCRMMAYISISFRNSP